MLTLLLCLQTVSPTDLLEPGLTVGGTGSVALPFDSNFNAAGVITGEIGYRSVRQAVAWEPFISVEALTWSKDIVAFRSWKNESVVGILLGVKGTIAVSPHSMVWAAAQLGGAHFSQDGGDCAMSDAECHSGFTLDASVWVGADFVFWRYVRLGPCASVGGGPEAAFRFGAAGGAVF